MDTINYSINVGSLYSERLFTVSYSDCSALLNDIILGNITNFSLTGLLQNSSDYITKIVYYPINIGGFISSYGISGTIVIGNKSASYSSAQQVTKLVNYLKIGDFTLTRLTDTFLDFEPFTKITFNFPYFEPIELPLKLCYGNQIDYFLSADFINNEFTLYLYRNTDNLFIASKTAKLGIELSLGKTNKEEQQRNNILQGISVFGSLAGLGIGINSGSPLVTAGSIGTLTKNINQSVQNNVDRLTSYKMGTGNRTSLAIQKTIYLLTERVQNVDFPSLSLKGKVLRANKDIDELSGYTEIGEIHFNPMGYDIMDDEISEIIELLRSGVIL